MLATAQRAGIAHVVDHELRFNPNRRRVRMLLGDGFVGVPRHVLITLASPSRHDPARPWGWWFDETRGGGLLGAVGSHQVDLLRYWLGEVEMAAGGLETFVRERPLPDGPGRRAVTADDFVSFALRLRGGVHATIVLSSVAAHPIGPRVELWGDEGTLVLDEAERLWGARRGAPLAELTVPETLTPPPGMEYAPLWGLSFVRLVDHLAGALLDGAPLTPAATFEDGVAVQRVLDAVRVASRGGWVRV
jgi:predicted dehydrogenase